MRDRFRGLTDNLNVHVSTVGRRVVDEDRFDDVPNTPNSPNAPTQSDELVPRPETLGPDGEIDWSPAPHNGFVLDANGNPISHEHVPSVGDRFDRYGDPNGRFVSPLPEDGPFSYDSRSLPYTENPNAYHQYEWTQSPADIQDVYDNLDGPTRDAVDATLDKYGLDLDALSHVTRGEAAAIPEWGTPGGATQDLLPVSITLLDKMGMIKEI